MYYAICHVLYITWPYMEIMVQSRFINIVDNERSHSDFMSHKSLQTCSHWPEIFITVLWRGCFTHSPFFLALDSKFILPKFQLIIHIQVYICTHIFRILDSKFYSYHRHGNCRCLVSIVQEEPQWYWKQVRIPMHARARQLTHIA